MAVAERVTEGHVPFSIGRTWYRSVAGKRDDGRVPLLGLTTEFSAPRCRREGGRAVAHRGADRIMSGLMSAILAAAHLINSIHMGDAHASSPSFCSTRM